MGMGAGVDVIACVQQGAGTEGVGVSVREDLGVGVVWWVGVCVCVCACVLFVCMCVFYTRAPRLFVPSPAMPHHCVFSL